MKPMLIKRVACAISAVARPSFCPLPSTAMASVTGGPATPLALTAKFAGAALSALAFRGGDITMENFNLDRVKIRLEGLTAYGVVTALLMNAALGLFASTPKELEEGKRVENVAKVIFCFSTALSVVAAAHTTVVFSLLGLYAKTALGMGLDAKFVDFHHATFGIRKMAFDAFILSLVTFETSFVTSIFIRCKGQLRKAATWFTAVLVAFSFWHWSIVMAVASKLMFS